MLEFSSTYRSEKGTALLENLGYKKVNLDSFAKGKAGIYSPEMIGNYLIAAASYPASDTEYDQLISICMPYVSNLSRMG